MKKLHYLLIFGLVLVFGCNSNKGGPCNIPSYQLKVADKTIKIELYEDYEAGLEVEYGPTNFAQGSGTIVSLANNVTIFTITDYGEYDVTIRKKCLSGGVSEWSARYNVNVDGGTAGCSVPSSLEFNGYKLMWYADNDFYDVEYGPTGFTIGNGIRIRTNSKYYQDAILTTGNTYDFYVRGSCGGGVFSHWAGPKSIYAQVDQNTNLPCTAPNNLYAYKINSQEINYTANGGQSNSSYEIAFSTSGSTQNGNILSTNTPNGTVGFNGNISGTTYYFWIRGRCSNGSFTNWAVSEVQ